MSKRQKTVIETPPEMRGTLTELEIMELRIVSLWYDKVDCTMEMFATLPMHDLRVLVNRAIKELHMRSRIRRGEDREVVSEIMSEALGSGKGD